MGVFSQSLAIPQASHSTTVDLLVRWLAAKGFEATTETPLFGCDENDERGFCVFSNER
jgi:hypothetical protein